MLRETTVKNGKLKGFPAADPRITAYKGIPFAAPPVGELRWRPPQPAENWDGVLEAAHFAPISVQDTPGLGGPEAFYDKEWHVDSNIPMSEDCLYLNVWTPAKSADEKLPVMFWIFGGGLQWGYPSEMEFDGERIARRGVVFVSVNYRLNVFGFLAHPEITAENPDMPANFGLLDQRAGMQWVKENIAAFGGDPGNITIFGQSAGAGSTMAHLASPMSRGLFHKAIPQSGGGIAPGFMNNQPDLAKAEAFGKGFFDFLGVSSLEQARRIDARLLLQKANEYPPAEGMFLKWITVLDGKFLSKTPREAYLDGEFDAVAIMTGCTADEFPIIPLKSAMTMRPGQRSQQPYDDNDFTAYAKERFGDSADKYMECCGFGREDISTVVKNGTINFFELGNLLWAHINDKIGKAPMYIYTFNPPMPGDNAGSFHSSELWFTFETLAKCWRPFKGGHYDLARLMCNYWTNFAKYGDPNGNDADGIPMPEWKPYTAGGPHRMYFDIDPAMDKVPVSDVLKLVLEHDLASPDISRRLS